MKIIISFLLLSLASSFTFPATTHRNIFTPKPLHAEEEEVEAEAPSLLGADGISSLTKDVKTIFTSEDIDKILPHVRKTITKCVFFDHVLILCYFI